MDRRAAVFTVFALVCGALVPATPNAHRWFAVALAVVYVVLALASQLDHRSRDRRYGPAPDASDPPSPDSPSPDPGFDPGR